MRLLIATTFAFFLTACTSIPGAQTVGLESDPDKPTKAVLVATGLMVDALAVYAALPDCGSGVGDACKKPKAYRDAKLIAQATVLTFAPLAKGQHRSSVFLSAALLYSQYQIAKTMASAPGPTNPESYPPPQTLQYLEAAGLADVLISTASERVQDGVSVNTSVGDLVMELEAKVAALP